MSPPIGSSRQTRLYAEPDVRVLWLTAGRSELALSVQGLWLHHGRREAELEWHELQQVQVVPAGALSRQREVRVEVFARDGRVHSLGPFARGPAERWIQACAEAATERGEEPLPLEGAIGFALAQ